MSTLIEEIKKEQEAYSKEILADSIKQVREYLVMRGCAHTFHAGAAEYYQREGLVVTLDDSYTDGRYLISMPE